MKYIVLPIAKFFKFLGIVLLVYPLAFVLCLLEVVWHWDKKYIVDLFKEPFGEEDPYIEDGVWKRKIYKTPIDWLRDRVTIELYEKTSIL